MKCVLEARFENPFARPSCSRLHHNIQVSYFLFFFNVDDIQLIVISLTWQYPVLSFILCYVMCWSFSPFLFDVRLCIFVLHPRTPLTPLVPLMCLFLHFLILSFIAFKCLSLYLEFNYVYLAIPFFSSKHSNFFIALISNFSTIMRCNKMLHLILWLLQAHIPSHSNLRSLLLKQNLQWYLFFLSKT